MSPTPEATRRAVERVRQTLVAAAATPAVFSRRIRMFKRLTVAAALLLGAGLLGAWLVGFVTGTRLSFAEVQAAMQKPRTLRFRQIIRVPGKPDQVSRPGCCKRDGGSEDADGTYTVTDLANHKALAVNPKEKKAVVFLQPREIPFNLYDKIKNLPAEAAAKPLPVKEIGGKRALGFRVPLEGVDVIGGKIEFSVWVDAQTRLPVLIESENKNEDGTVVRLTLDEFVFDQELDPKLFSFDVPDGYKVRKEGTAAFPDAPKDANLRDLVVTPRVGIGPVKFGTKREEIIKLLGEPDGSKEMGKTVQMSYASRGFFLTVGKELGVVSIFCASQKVMPVRARDFAGKTDKGIALGASPRTSRLPTASRITARPRWGRPT